MADILIIDDDEMLCDMLCSHLKRMAHDAAYALNLEDGIRAVASRPFDVVFLDVNLPDGNGLDAIPAIRESPAAPEVIIFTAEGEPDGAETAIRSGAWDYIEKPPSVRGMTLPLVRALQYREEKRRKKESRAVLKREDIVGTSSPLKKCLDLVADAANSDLTVLITGETGTGKELFAKAVHQNSGRADKNFVVVDCAALPGNLVEGTLFGYEKGAFTGAHSANTGLVKQADKGTLFLDEVGELPLTIQKSFLRVLQERRVRPLGGRREIESDFRLVAATNRDLDEMVRTGTFRQDLLFRLKTLTIELPPLRTRRKDIQEIAFHYMRKFSERYATDTKGFSPEFLEALNLYDWPGNVRELVNSMERALVRARRDPTLFTRHLPTHIRIRAARTALGERPPVQRENKWESNRSASLPTLKEFRRQAFIELEQQYLRDLISLTDSDMKEACRISGLSRSRLYGLLKDHRISRPD